ncbi:MAG: hypothetical protein LBD65_04685 [Spirochaetaceae bacterium]|jgi:hypothetical protein|nr:hypothetical protein [Spirochaetaceae bacterium]
MKKTSIIIILVLLFVAGINAGCRGLKQALNQTPVVTVAPTPEFVSVPPLPKTPFTVSLRRILPEDQLNRVQFYLSNSLTLLKEENKLNVKVDSEGKIIRTDGLDSNQIKIPMETPGRLGQINTDEYDVLAICFEDSNVNNNVIYFQPNPEKDRYELMFFSRDGIKLIRYGDTDYEISYSRELPYLLVINEQQKNDNINTRTVTGRSP